MNPPIFAGVLERVFATVIDGLVTIAALFAVFGVSGELTLGSTTLTLATMWLVLILIEARAGGTPGKLLVGLRVTLADGTSSPVGVRLALIRRVPDFVGMVPVIGQLLTIALGAASIVMVRRDAEQRRSPYDWVSNTRVVLDDRRAR